MSGELFTIGHSRHEIDVFIGLLQRYKITALADVRSSPYCSFVSQYSRDPLSFALGKVGIAYVFLGSELGARSDNPACYKDGRVHFDLLAQEPRFKQGLRRVVQGMDRYRVALMCTEKDPVDCHRAILIARWIVALGIAVQHILPEGGLESHEKMEQRLLNIYNLPECDDCEIFGKTREGFLLEAYRMQEERVAYRDKAVHDEEGVIAI